jgi:hypothetical protein
MVLIFSSWRGTSTTTSKTDRYKAQLISPNEVLLAVPTVTHSYLHHFDNLFAQMKATGENYECAQDAHAVSRNAILSDKDRQTKHLLLRFPEDTELSTRHYAQEATDNELSCELIPYQTSYDINGKSYSNTVPVIYWKVSLVEQDQRVAKRADR